MNTKNQINKINRPPRSFVKKAGLPPGSLLYTGTKNKELVNTTLIRFKGDFFEEQNISDLDNLLQKEEATINTWVNFDGIHNTAIIEKAGQLFDIHPLVLEDISHNIQRPKIEDYPNQLYIVLRNFQYNTKSLILHNEQLSIILGENYLLTFQENPITAFEDVKERLKKGGPRLRNSGTDYLAYAIMDAIVDNYFHILEKIGEEIETLEDQLLINPKKNDIQKIHQLRRDLIILRKSVWPLRELLNTLQRNENGIFKKTTVVFLRDVYDHTIQVIETIESYREMVIGMLDVYLSSLSNKMNEVMKVLTIIATVFIPLTFLAGVYGMNFINFPELKMNWMYPWGFWGITIITIGFMIWFFKRKRWI